ncbi:MAG: methylated-DNA--[protein]-cysteine S-methyltransferase [Verrucomicrobiota bacterium JB023]|nr:methylated-DNA--[protein]-cysteine S-methyltransferase [Verrucomicrobiota bacterium JB023]
MIKTSGSPIMAGAVIKSPVGPLTLLASDDGLAGVYYEGKYEGKVPDAQNEFTEWATKELGEYFAKERKEFTVPLAPEGTVFQLEVWQELRQIVFGQTASYKEIAQRLGRPKSVRAVGMANGCNPISIIVPCHRVIGSAGDLVGYGGGLGRKHMLLTLEGAVDEELW